MKGINYGMVETGELSLLTVGKASVVKIISERQGLQEIQVQTDLGIMEKAVVYPDLTGRAKPGDEVWLNTTAVRLGLGTGGVHFVQAVIGKEARLAEGPGHIMKLRYTPWQIKCLAVEEDDSPHHNALLKFSSLKGMPVIVATLHSMLPLVLAGFHHRCGRHAVVAYIMTDGAALPMAFSRTVAELKTKGLLTTTITAGHAFGGDLEAITVPSALAAAKAVVGADLAVIAMGPGIVGSGTKYGFTGMEQAHYLEDVERLGGAAIAVPRVSSADFRERHRGLSHHSRTVLEEMTYASAWIGWPEGGTDQDLLEPILEASKLGERHRVRRVNLPDVGRVLETYGLRVTSMGRDYRQDPAFFAVTMAAGLLAAEILEQRAEGEG